MEDLEHLELTFNQDHIFLPFYAVTSRNSSNLFLAWKRNLKCKHRFLVVNSNLL